MAFIYHFGNKDMANAGITLVLLIVPVPNMYSTENSMVVLGIMVEGILSLVA